MRRLWLVRLGRNGEFEDTALREGRLTVGFGTEGEDLSRAGDRDALLAVMDRLHPDAKPKARANYAAQVNQFLNVARVGDLVVTPLKTFDSKVAIGELVGPYERDAAGRTTRAVKWLRQDVPRDAFHQDLLFSLGAIQTVCEIYRNGAVTRVEAVLRTGADPGDGAGPAAPRRTTEGPVAASAIGEAGDGPIDLERIARDQIERRIASAFAGHDLTRLVAAILEARGYIARVSPPGADRGVDIVAGSGPLGLESPRVTVQVKSGSEVVGQPVLQGLIGSVQDTQADHGLIVSWGGFTKPVRDRTNELFFRVRLWGRDELVDALFGVYDRLPEAIRAELPLRRTWTLVSDPDEELE